MQRFIRTLCLVLAASLALAHRASAQDGGLSLLRDAEIETTMRTFATPVWKAAGLDPQAIHIYIVNDPTLNSFVAGGQNLFMNTGTILRASLAQPARRHHRPRNRPHRRRPSRRAPTR